MKAPQTLNDPVESLSQDEIIEEIVYITEVKFANSKLPNSEVCYFTVRMNKLLRLMPEGSEKVRILEKLKLKSRFSPYFNDTGILDFTGYGEHLY